MIDAPGRLTQLWLTMQGYANNLLGNGVKVKTRSIFPIAMFLMGTDNCAPTLPELDPVVSSDPAVVSSLRDSHADILYVLSKFEHGTPFPIDADSVYFQHLSAIQMAIPEVSALTSFVFQVSEERHPTCEQAHFLLYTVGITTVPKRLRRSQVHELQFLVCDQDFDVENRVFDVRVLGDIPVDIDTPRLGQVLAENFREMMSDVDEYMSDFERQQHAILATILDVRKAANTTTTPCCGSHPVASTGVLATGCVMDRTSREH